MSIEFSSYDDGSPIADQASEIEGWLTAHPWGEVCAEDHDSAKLHYVPKLSAFMELVAVNVRLAVLVKRLAKERDTKS